MKRNKKFVFKKSIFRFIDLLKAKKIANKSYETITSESSNDHQIKTDYHVNQLAKQLHPKEINVYIKNIIQETHDTKSFVLSSKTKQLAYFRAGQYVSVRRKNDNIARPYSIASSPNDALNNQYLLTIKKVPNGYLSNYFFNQAKINDELVLSGPDGTFYYDNIRDPKHIVAIAGGSGITCFHSLMKAIQEKTENFYLTLIYAIKTERDIIFKDQLENLSKNEKIKIVYVFSDQLQKENFETKNETFYKRLDLKIINKYYSRGDGLWICGSKGLLNYILSIIKTLKIKQKLIRYESHNDIGKPSDYQQYKNLNKSKTYTIKLHQFNTINQYQISADETILSGLQKQGVNIKTKCLSGWCSCCRFRLIKGNVFCPKEFDHRRKADNDNNIYFACCCFAVSDIEIEVY